MRLPPTSHLTPTDLIERSDRMAASRPYGTGLFSRRRGAAMLEYALLTILLTGVLAWSLRSFTPQLIRAGLTRYNNIFTNFPN